MSTEQTAVTIESLKERLASLDDMSEMSRYLLFVCENLGENGMHELAYCVSNARMNLIFLRDIAKKLLKHAEKHAEKNAEKNAEKTCKGLK